MHNTQYGDAVLGDLVEDYVAYMFMATHCCTSFLAGLPMRGCIARRAKQSKRLLR